jgi:hypothetical protein
MEFHENLFFHRIPWNSMEFYETGVDGIPWNSVSTGREMKSKF